MKRFEEISSINAALVYGHKINNLLLIYLVYYMRLMLGRISLLLNYLYRAVEHKGNDKKLSDHEKMAIFVSQ